VSRVVTIRHEGLDQTRFDAAAERIDREGKAGLRSRGEVCAKRLAQAEIAIRTVDEAMKRTQGAFTPAGRGDARRYL
jgi:hypothetical protein